MVRDLETVLYKGWYEKVRVRQNTAKCQAKQGAKDFACIISFTSKQQWQEKKLRIRGWKSIAQGQRAAGDWARSHTHVL